MQIWIMLLLTGFLISTRETMLDYNLIPKTVQEWQADGDDKIYDRETLYDYIDGGAELYLTYAFQQVWVRNYIRTNYPDLVLEIYDMGNPTDALGIFSTERADPDIGIGQDSEYGGGLLRFWQGRYFVSLVAIGAEKLAKPALFELARSVAQALPASDLQPELLAFLPQTGLQKEKILLFHSHEILNRRYFLASDNILNLNPDTDCILAPYDVSDQTARLLLVRYPTDSLAESGYSRFISAFMPDADKDASVQMENGKWAFARQQDNFVIVILDAPEREWMVAFFDEVVRRIKE